MSALKFYRLWILTRDGLDFVDADVIFIAAVAV